LRATEVLFVVALVVRSAVTLSAQTADTTNGAPLGWPAGVRFEVGYTGDVFAPVRGGLSREAVYLDNLDLLLGLDLEVLLGARKTSLRFHVQSNRGRLISARVGDLQGVSNIQAPNGWRLYEAWLEHNVIPGRLSLLLGVYDVNSEVDVIPGAGDFLNSSFGFGPEYSLSGLNGPSTFPFTTVGVRFRARPVRNVYMQLAVSDGSPGLPDDAERSRFSLGGGEGALISWEGGYAEPAPGVAVIFDEPPSRVQEGGRRIGRGRTSRRLRTKLGIGGWVYTQDFLALESGQPPATSWGLYVLGERLISKGPRGEGGFSIFARAGTAADEVNRVSVYLGGGAVYSGPLPGREQDVVGLGVAHARNGTPFLRATAALGFPRERAEAAVEFSYRIHVSDLFQFQPVAQWVVNPDMNPNVDNALVLGVRGMLTVELP
jgi:porin